ncbi:iron uptake transporter deferrochelatase/peroxidase subunit [Gorillibacterium massiliense]|uniref:iron uptake transporter deferrochelatase/peroxidase subunit n=1 Tax=Gorillibacterium massiliense TaxID=1280390 RepID=UPI0005940857|nr:iron uptake transporter deferrochelatase/peroxidase subunit [Gorillibacterium massiliense]
MENQQEASKASRISRREFLKLSAAAGTGLAIGATGTGAILGLMTPAKKAQADVAGSEDTISMYGAHQAGIITPQQTYLYLASFRITASDRASVIKLLREWTKFADLSTRGGTAITGSNRLVPPADTGETLDLPAAKLTTTFGFGPSFFLSEGKDRFGIGKQAARYLQDIPRMSKDFLDADRSGGDICIQVCAEDQQVAFHAVRNFIRLSTGYASLKWMEEGFISGGSGKTPRNLFGFKDGTANAEHQTSSGYEDVVWTGAGEPAWMAGGSYLAYRKIRMLLEVWDRTSYSDQEDTFGRYKESGAAYGSTGEFDPVNVSRLPADSHVSLAKQTGQRIHRRAYSYTGSVDLRTGNVDAGLLFLSYQRNPEEQFIPMLRMMQSKDKLNEYTAHIASGMFACPGGLRQGEYIGQRIFEG